MLEHVYIRKRRDTYNQHALHQTVASSFKPTVQLRSTVVHEDEPSPRSSQPTAPPLDEDRPGKIVHETAAYTDDPQPNETGSESGSSTTPMGTLLLALNLSDSSVTNSTPTTVASSSSVSVAFYSYASSSVSLNRPSETPPGSAIELGYPRDSVVAVTTDPVTPEDVQSTGWTVDGGKVETVSEDDVSQHEDSTLNVENGTVSSVESLLQSSTTGSSTVSTPGSTSDLEEPVPPVEESSAENSASEKNTFDNTSDVVKETRELSREDLSTEPDAPASGLKSSEKSEELQRDYPLPIYNYGQEEVEIVKLNHGGESDTVTKTRLDRTSSYGNSVPRLGQNSDLRVITREESDEEFLREFEKKFREDDAVTDQEEIPKDTRIPPNVPVEPNPPLTQQVKIIEVPVDRSHPSPSSASSASSSPHRVLVNITIASGESSSKPLYVLSVSVPTDGHAHQTAEVHQQQESGSNVVSNTNDNRLPPPPQPPSSPPPPLWAGGECECSCPCMGSGSDEWDNFSAIDENNEHEIDNSSLSIEPSKMAEEEEEEVAEENFSTTEENAGSTDWTTANYDTESSSVDLSCSGSTPLPPEPTILILEGEAPFMVSFFFSASFFSLSLSFSLLRSCRLSYT